MKEIYCKVNETPTHNPFDKNIACLLDICYWNIGLEFLPDNCACKDIRISQGAECLSFISKVEAKERIDKAFYDTKREI
uniref:Uncharacterized protein n=1 Tax=viral metagenome TaxID=1070528 RepID=A0A6H2A182_9ZZZZ